MSQQVVPQQNCVPMQAIPPSQGGAAWQLPWLQNGNALSPQTVLQPPQFLMSLSVFTHTSSQQVN
jgi:hypothetical protein